ncbi:transglycosylase SLT domain-containing protein [Jatrophihabitans sp. DSM 45814]
MTASVDGVSSILARISQLQAQFPQLAPPVLKPTATNTATNAATNAATSFAAALNSASAVSSPASSGGLTGSQVVASAEKYLGVPYVFGGTTSAGIDCSGLVQRAYGDLGVQLPRLSWDQAKTGTAVPDLAHAQPGDILGFGNPAEHVAIYLGDNMMIAAPQPGENVKIQSVYETPASIRRIVAPDTANVASTGLNAIGGLSALTDSLGLGSGSTTGFATPGASATQTAGSLAQYANLFTQSEAAYQLPSGLLAAVAQTESGGNASAVSPAGAQGLMQLMPGTAAGLGVNPWDPTQAVHGAAELLGSYLKKYGSVPLALAAYNAGPGAVDQYGGVPPFAETQNYVAKITGLMGMA